MTNLEQQKDDPNYQLEELNKKADSLPDASKEEA